MPSSITYLSKSFLSSIFNRFKSYCLHYSSILLLLLLRSIVFERLVSISCKMVSLPMWYYTELDIAAEVRGLAQTIVELWQTSPVDACTDRRRFAQTYSLLLNTKTFLLNPSYPTT